ncbi:MAG: ABC transporter permease [Desulfocapsaceae bacterium]|jgi:lipopolysaccharide transport system permease protein/teichoic acid transport system permease protein|nr:ABC transporter permease [Desulfocapsaceae bacterium]
MISKVTEFINHLVLNRNLLYQLTKRDLTQQYRSSLLGIFWAVIEPITFMLLLAFVFEVGLKAGKMMDVPFVAYIISGMSIFLLSSSVLGQGAMIIKSNAYLLNKVNFKVSVLPIVKICSKTITHFFTLLPVLMILIFEGFYPNWYWIQTLYYLGALVFLLVGAVLLISALAIFIPDIGNIVSIINRFLLYLSPVFWDISVFPTNVQTILKINPLYYIVSGYRESLLFNVGFWMHPYLTLYYWSFSLIIFIVGALIFRHLKPYFSDFV